MKVYLVKWISAEYSGVHKVFYSKEKAQEFVDEHSGAIIDDEYIIGQRIEEHEVT